MDNDLLALGKANPLGATDNLTIREIVECPYFVYKAPTDTQSLMKEAGPKKRIRFRKAIPHLIITEGRIEPTIPDKPLSNKQNYGLTDKSSQALQKREGGDY